MLLKKGGGLRGQRVVNFVFELEDNQSSRQGLKCLVRLAPFLEREVYCKITRGARMKASTDEDRSVEGGKIHLSHTVRRKISI